MTPPPRLGEWLTGALAPGRCRDEILGDLAELWHVHLCSRRRGRWLYWRHAISLLVWARRAPDHNPADPDPAPRRPGARLAQDLRYALRLARRQPGFTAVAVATLALGIAAATAIFTICDRVLIQPLPYADPDRIVVLHKVSFGFSARGMTVGRAAASSPALSAVGLYAPGGMNLGEADAPQRVNAAVVTHGFFQSLGAQPVAGRALTPDDDRDFARVAVLSFDLWRRRFHEDRAAIGREIRLNSQAFTVVGVMPRGFDFPADASVWVPIGSDGQVTGGALAPSVVARLAPDMTPAQAAEALTRAEGAARPGGDNDPAIVTSLKEELVGGARPNLLLLAALVGLLLAATSANVAGLLLSRLRVRQRELSLRSALGASRGRLVAQLTVESGAIAAAGAALGLVLTFWMLRAFEAAVPTFAAHVDLSHPGFDVFGVAGAVTALSTLIAGAGPALAVRKRAPADILRAGASTARSSRWFGQSLVVAQIALALVLLAGTSATLAVLARLGRVDLGFDNPRAIVFELTIPLSRYGSAAGVPALIAEIERGLRAIPGVSSVGVTDYAPGSAQTGIGMPIAAPGDPEPADGSRQTASLLIATPDYFRAMGIRMIAGRAFTERDVAAAPRVAILSESAARALAGEPARAIGRRVEDRFRPNAGGLEVVGVVADVRLRRRMTGTQAQLYQPVAQTFVRGSAGVAIDADGEVETVIARARDVLRRIDADLPIYSVLRLSDLRARYLATERVTVALTAAFGGLSIVLAAVGLYGLL
jgi:predicted permease